MEDLPEDHEKVEFLPTTLPAHPGFSKSGGNEAPTLDVQLSQQHNEVMKKLLKHERLLRLVLQDSNLFRASLAQKPNSSRSDELLSTLRTQSDRGKNSPRRDVHAELGAIKRELSDSGSCASSSGVRREKSSPPLFESYTAYDLKLQSEAQAMETKISKKKFASVHMQNAVGKSMDSTRKALRGIHALVERPSFDIFFAFIVFVNAIFIGFQVQSEISASMMTPIETRMVNYCFGCFFTIELICRLLHGGLAFFYSENWMWNWLDFIVVTASIVEVVMNAVEVAQGGVEDLSSITGFKIFRILRLTKIVKVVRLVRIFRFVSALRTLVTSIAHTLKALFWALTLLAVIVYVFAVLFSQVLHDHITDPTLPPLSADADAARIKYFGSLPETMLSLFMSIAGGVSWEDVIFPLKAVNLLWVFCFLFYVSFTYFAVLNVVTGVFCQSAIENAQKDHAAVVQNILDNKEFHLKKIRDLFSKLGADYTGVITFSMLEEAFDTRAVAEYFESLGLDVSDAWSFFKLLDADGGGSVEVEEFLLGCLRLRGQARAMDIAKLSFDQHWLIKSQGRFQQFVEEAIEVLTVEVRTLGQICRE
eukprot:symbB.v1.2.005136.t1/scaffold226.1/size261315/15